MKSVGIVPNFDKDKHLEFTKEIISYLIEKGVNPIYSKQVANELQNDKYIGDVEDIYKLSDFIISIGGDGTLLGVAKKSAIYDKPILGINLGTLGYLTDVEKIDSKQVIDRVLKGDFKTEKRMMLEASITNRQDDTGINIALNDICVTRGVFSKIIDLKVFVNGQYLDSYRADGIIVSTPTGSTAYNLSAGGPILKPDTHMVAITPICSHTLYSRSAVVSADDVIKLQVSNNVNTDILMSIDGQSGIALNRDDIVLIKRSDFYTTIIKTNDLSFYDILRKKMINK